MSYDRILQKMREEAAEQRDATKKGRRERDPGKHLRKVRRDEARGAAVKAGWGALYGQA